MTRLNFRLPESKICTVVWYRNGKRNETLIDTPANNEQLANVMLMEHRVGASEIRTVKGIETGSLAEAMMAI